MAAVLVGVVFPGMAAVVEGDGSFARTVEVRVLLRTANGVGEFGQIGSPYVDGYGDVAFEKVVIEKADGRIVEVNNGLVEDVIPFGVTQTSIAADIRFKKMTIPGLEPGDSLFCRMVLRGGRAAAAVPTVGDLGINIDRYCRNHGHPMAHAMLTERATDGSASQGIAT